MLEFLRKVCIGCDFSSAYLLGIHAFLSPCQVAEEKYERLMSAAPAATLDCSGLFDGTKAIKVIEQAATKHAGSYLGACEVVSLRLRVSRSASSQRVGYSRPEAS